MTRTPADTTVETNKELLRWYKVEILNSRDIDALDEVAALDYLDHAAFPGQAPGLEGLKQRVATLFRALDPHWTINDIIAEGDMVVLRWSHTGTHVGDFLGIPPTGKSFVFRGIDMYRVRAGKMAEHWNVVDTFGFLQQIGLLAEPTVPGRRELRDNVAPNRAEPQFARVQG
ncbi:MAG: ester cyclase [Actinomycetota bacterium]